MAPYFFRETISSSHGYVFKQITLIDRNREEFCELHIFVIFTIMDTVMSLLYYNSVSSVHKAN